MDQIVKHALLTGGDGCHGSVVAKAGIVGASLYEYGCSERCPRAKHEWVLTLMAVLAGLQSVWHYKTIPVSINVMYV